MIMLLPMTPCDKELVYLRNKIIQSKIVKGIYTGYNMEDDIPVSLVHGYSGWNLFINRHCPEDTICNMLYCILKNKNAILFNMDNMGECEIYFKEKLDK